MKYEIIGKKKKELERSVNFQRWLEEFDNNAVRIRQIEEYWSYWKGENSDELVFALLFLRYLDESGEEKRSIVFYRNNSVAGFLVLIDEKTEQKYVVLVEQIRAPSGRKLLEIPAGTIEENGNPLDTIVREMEEEVSLSIPKNRFGYFDLGDYYFSPGACNEKIYLFSCEVRLTADAIEKLHNKFTGTPGENTKVRIFSMKDFEALHIDDAKTRLAYELYKRGFNRDIRII